MYSICLVGNSSGTYKYYRSDDYYLQNGEVASEWLGKGASILGLSGKVDEDNFKALLCGQVDGVQVGRNGSDITHRAAYDITASAPKSVSILALMHNADERLIKAHHQANKIGMAIFEENTIARQTVLGKTSAVNTSNLISASFTHTTSRKLDPQLHTHNVTMNLTRREDDKWRSVEARNWFINRKYAGMVYKSELARLVQALGYEIEVNHKTGNFEIKGVPEHVINNFSQRKNEMDALAKERDVQGAKAMSQIAIETREKKQRANTSQLHDQWDKRFKALNFNPDKIIQAAKDKHLQHHQTASQFYESPEDKIKQVYTDVLLAKKILADKEAAFMHDKLMDLTLKLGLGRYGHQEIKQATAQLIDENILVKASIHTHTTTLDPTKVVYTTPQALAKERYILKLLDQGKDTQTQIVTKARVNEHILATEHSTQNTFKPGQKNAIAFIMQAKDQVIGIQGTAGTGKTYMLKTAAELIEGANIKIRGLSPTNSGAQTLQKDTGIEAQTLASFLYAMENNSEKVEQSKKQQELWLIDEASLVNASDMANFITLLRKTNNRAVLVGDRAQLGAIEWGKPFILMMSRGLQYTLMREIVRQKEKDLQESVEFASQGKIKESMARIAPHIYESPDRAHLKAQISADYLSLSAKQRQNTLVVIPDNKTRNEVMRDIRAGLIEQGVVAGNQLNATILVNTGMGAEKQDARFYEPGQIVEFGKKYKTLGEGVNTGDRFIVSSVDKDHNIVNLSFLKPNSLTPDKDRTNRHYFVSSIPSNKARLKEHAQNRDILITRDHNSYAIYSVHSKTQQYNMQAPIRIYDKTNREDDKKARKILDKTYQAYGNSDTPWHNQRLARLVNKSVSTNGGHTKKNDTFAWNPLKVAGKAKFGVEVFQQEKRDLGVGDTILWNKTLSREKLNNGDKGEIIKIEGRIITVKFDNGTIRELDTNALRNFNYAYASTVFIAQGQTYDKALGIIESYRKNLVDQKSYYVFLSRGRYQSITYTNDKKDLLQELSNRTGEKTSAIEVTRDTPAKTHAFEKTKGSVQKTKQQEIDLSDFL